MRISVTDAKAQLTELVRRAEAGEVIELTRHGQAVATINPVKVELTADELREKRRRGLAELRAAHMHATPGPDAAHAAEFLYDESGLPK